MFYFTYNNSQITGNNITLHTTGDANVLGANIHANDNLHTDIGGDLNLVSQQNTASGSNHGIGLSGGVGSDEGNINSANAGINSSNGRYYTSETVQTSLTSGGSANVTVNGNTHLEGALLATIDENGQDSGKLNLSTESLSYRDLSNSHYDSNQSMGLSSNVGIGNAPATTDDPLANIDTKNQSSSMQYSNTSSTSLGKTLATLGEGDITIGGESQNDSTGKSSDLLAGLNRDTQNTEKELYSVDRQQGNVDVTVDHRLATGNLEAIGDDIDKTIENVVTAKRHIQTWGDQAPENVQLLMPGIETHIESQILAGEDVDQIMAALNSDELTDAVNMLAPLVALSESNPELLKETMAAAQAIDEGKVFTDENGMQYIEINGSGKIPLKAEILDSLGVVNESLKAVVESDSAAIAAMLLTGIKGLPGMIVETAVDAVVGDNIEEIKAYASDKISTWGTDKTSDDFYDSLAEEQKFKDSDFHTNVDGGSELVVNLAAGIIVGKAVTGKGGKGDKDTSTNNDTQVAQSSDKSTVDKVDVNSGKVDTDGAGSNTLLPKTETFGFSPKYWEKPTVVNDRKVYKRDDLFDASAVDQNGLTNLQRMQKGKPPIGSDGTPVNLHHLTQKEPGALAEVGGKMHSDNTKVLHGIAKPQSSFRYSKDGKATDAEKSFNRYRYKYWQDRAKAISEKNGE